MNASATRRRQGSREQQSEKEHISLRIARVIASAPLIGLVWELFFR